MQKLSDIIKAGEVFLTVPLESLTDEQQKLVQEKREEMTQVNGIDTSQRLGFWLLQIFHSLLECVLFLDMWAAGICIQ